METTRDIQHFICLDPGLSELQHEVALSATGDLADDTGHLLRVALWTCRIGGLDIKHRNAVAAALCHDFVNLPKTSPYRSQASTLSSEKARGILPALGFDPAAVSEIIEAIRDHSYSHGATPAALLGQALQDADRLDALGSIGLLRHISTATSIGAIYFHPEDPWSEHRQLDEGKFAIDHYFTKLLRLPGRMCTVIGRKEAERRAKLMIMFLDELGIDISIPRPQSRD